MTYTDSETGEECRVIEHGTGWADIENVAWVRVEFTDREEIFHMMTFVRRYMPELPCEAMA